MKISLVEPKSPSYNVYTTLIKRLPMMGPIYLGTILKNDGHDVTIYNENIKEIDYSKIKNSDILGISIMTSPLPEVMRSPRISERLTPRGESSSAECMPPSCPRKQHSMPTMW